MTDKEKELREYIFSLKKEHIERLSFLRRNFEILREAACTTRGGHFWSGEYKSALSPFGTSIFRRCKTCEKREKVKDGVSGDNAFIEECLKEKKEEGE